MGKLTENSARDFKSKLKKNDLVVVISGKEKGKTGKILNFNRKKGRVFVEGVNVVKKTVKKTRENPKGGIINQEASIHISNVMYYDSSSNKRCRIGYQVDKDKKKVRVFKQIKK